MKYQSVYKAVSKIPYTSISDYKNDFYDLWLVLEIPSKHLRVWITHKFNRLCIATACLDYKCDSREYHASFKERTFNKMGDMIKFIESELQ